MTMSRIQALSLLIAFLALWPAKSSAGSASTSDSNRKAGTRVTSSEPPKDVLATVNGKPVTELDVQYKMKSGGHSGGGAPRQRPDTLEEIIREELCYQRAVALGLDADPVYREKLRQFEVQLDFFKRKELTELFVRREIEAKAPVTEAEAARYFAANAGRLRTEIHIWQILRRDESAIKQALKDLEDGIPFEQVAAQQFPQLPETGQQPWDLGYLKWNQIPEPWREIVYDLKSGAISGVIRGPKGRFWILKLIDRRDNPTITFESVRPILLESLQHSRIQDLRERIGRNLRHHARVVYTAGRPSVAVPNSTSE